MKSLSGFIALTIVMVLSSCNSDRLSEARVTTQIGVIQGKVENGISVFRDTLCRTSRG